MKETEHVELRRGYADSVTLMLVSRRVSEVDGVSAALIAMATPLNLDLLRDLGFGAPDAAGPDDLLVAIRAEPAALTSALVTVEDGLRPPAPATPSAEAPPRTIGSALRAGRGLALVSVPGASAFVEAMDALEADCDVLVFSDNVPVWQEIRLKQVAAERGLLVMGPDCGTAVLAGAGLGFSHCLDRGPVGMVAASGTGAQQVLCLLDAAGVGVSAALGVGGRDLSADVGGRSTLAALDILDADPSTELIVLISKPPADSVADTIRTHLATLATPVHLGLIGQQDLTQTTEGVLAALGRPTPDWSHRPGRATPRRPGWLRGLFCGGTLCDEAMVIASAGLGPVGSNIPLQPDWRRPFDADGHLMLDFGDDALTVGRAHPMIDPALRTERLRREVADPRVGTVLIDVVLGHGAHPDPAADLAPVIAAAATPVVVSLIGARRDPQDAEAQASRLSAAGAHVFASNAHAAQFAVDLVRS